MHLSTLTNSFSQLQAAATNIRNATIGSPCAVSRALHEIHWENIGNNIREVTVNAAVCAVRAYDHTEQMFRSIF